MHPLLSKKKAIALMVPIDVWTVVKQRASVAGRSINGYVTEALLEKIERENAQEKMAKALFPNQPSNDGQDTQHGAEQHL
jgi:hypothetical protein